MENKLNEQKVLELLGPNSPLATLLAGFESRPQQQKMMGDVLKAYNNKGISLIEAGTGTGKSLAYLIPAALWAKVTGERTVISTKTIALQEQLFHKDIPLVAKIIGSEIKAVIVKGMGNYLCLRKLTDISHEASTLTLQEADELNKIELWAETTSDGSRSTLSFIPLSSTWEKVCAESDTCTNVRCEFYEQCHFFKAREEARNAQILIANHHLLFADLQRREQDENYNDDAILPYYTGVILDEAHHIEEVATEYFASKAGKIPLLKTLARIGAEKAGKIVGKLAHLRDLFHSYYINDMPESCRSISRRLMHDLPAFRRELQEVIHLSFTSFDQFLPKGQESHESEIPDSRGKESKLRILPDHKKNEAWVPYMEEPSKKLVEALQRFVQSLNALENDLKYLDDEKLNEKTKTVRVELAALGNRLGEAAYMLIRFLQDIDNQYKVQWIESHQFKSLMNTTLVSAELDIAASLVKTLFKPFKTVILCSATLTTNNHFAFIKKSLGITPEYLPNVNIYESVYESPFDYQKQALFAIPTDIPLPHEPDFNRAVSEKIWEVIQASRGNAFILFTSFQALRECHHILEERLNQNRYHTLKHGDESRRALLDKFKARERSVLFGTDTFWEGVDVSGEALRCVIIVKLPFKVPSEPIIQARTEAIQARGGDSFREYSLPNAIVKFKQGFGRLIRNKNDRGCIVCFDGRLLNKSYGKQFLQSLPNCEKVFVESQKIVSQMGEFYRKTHYLTKL